MKNTDILTGRIIQRVLNAKSNNADEVFIRHGIGNAANISIERLIKNLFDYFPDSKITFQKLQFGYELVIRVCFRKENNK